MSEKLRGSCATSPRAPAIPFRRQSHGPSSPRPDASVRRKQSTWQERAEKELGTDRAFRYTVFAGWSSQVARWAHNPKVAGSNPAPAITYSQREISSVLKTP